jgi:hypothetical protein
MVKAVDMEFALEAACSYLSEVIKKKDSSDWRSIECSASDEELRTAQEFLTSELQRCRSSPFEPDPSRDEKSELKRRDDCVKMFERLLAGVNGALGSGEGKSRGERLAAVYIDAFGFEQEVNKNLRDSEEVVSRQAPGEMRRTLKGALAFIMERKRQKR